MSYQFSMVVVEDCQVGSLLDLSQCIISKYQLFIIITYIKDINDNICWQA